MDSKIVIALLTLLFYDQTGAMSLLFKEQRQKRMKIDFWDRHVALHEETNEYIHSPREIIVYCLPTFVNLMKIQITL